MKAKNFEKRVKLLLFLILIFSAVLRVLFLDRFPPSPYSDEVNQAYNAFSILKTGKDEHGVFLPVSLRSFGDWKPSLPTYLMIPTIFIFGLNKLAMRLPNAILGFFSIFLTYLLVKRFFKGNLYQEKLALFTSFLMAISPWHLHQSRSSMLVVVALFFFMLAVYCFLLGLRRSYFWYLSAISFVLSIYAYYGTRVIIPLFLLFLFVKYRKKLLSLRSNFFLAVAIGLLSLLPLFISFFFEPNVLLGRVKTVSVFFDRGIRLRLSQLQTEDQLMKVGPYFSLTFHHKTYLYTLDTLRRFFSHLDGRFLALTGDTAPPFRIPNMGVIYFIELLFLPLGIFFLLRNKEKNHNIIIFWLMIAIIPSAFSYLTPSHNRSFLSIFPIISISAYGILSMLFKLGEKKIFMPLVLVIIYVFSFYYYLINYYKILPFEFASDWLYGYKELVLYINQNDLKFSQIYFLPKTGMSYIYILFYNQYPPQRYIKEARHDYTLDQFGFEHVNGFAKYTFLRKERSWEEIRHLMSEGELYIGREEEIPDDFVKDEIYYPNGRVVFRVAYL